MEAKHTPGPWQAVQWRNNGAGFNILTAPHDHAKLGHPSSDFIGNVGSCGNPWQHGDAESAANGRLIAAAPDLLAALEELDAVGRRLGVRPMASRLDAHAAALARARAAILKARGE